MMCGDVVAPSAASDKLISYIEAGNCDKLFDAVYAGINVNVPSSSGVPPLLVAAFKGDMKCLQVLLDAEADINISDKDGWTALMFTAFSGTTEICKYLLQQGASPFLRNSNNQCAHDLAKGSGHTEVQCDISLSITHY